MCRGRWTPPSGPRYVKTLVQPSGESLAQLAAMIDAGELKVHIAKVMTLEEAGAAQDIVIDGHAGGKVVLTI